MKEKRFTTIEERKEKSKEELLAIPKCAFQKISRFGKNAGISVLYLMGVTLKGTGTSRIKANKMRDENVKTLLSAYMGGF